ncbi:MAG: response regulator transcription factor [Chloroherpetonaceae bacterium]|nr:response regulator transcription factor [Chloroherpetonaceae bacterium]
MDARILVVEDDERLASVLTKGLSEAGFAVERVADAETALERLSATSFALLLVDVMLPKMSGIELCRKLKAQKPSLPIIMLTALGEIDDKLKGFDAGADDYLAKPFDFRELLARINARLKAQSAPSSESEVLTYADLTMNLRTKVVKRQGKDIPLTAKEFALLEFFLRNPERVLSREEISKTVWNCALQHRHELH